MIAIIVAMDENNLIGNGNALPWKLPADLKRFKAITTGNTVFMGRLTYESIGKPLPNRKNIVLSRNNIKIDGCTVLNSIDDIVKQNNGEIFCIGGRQVYELAMPYASTIYITRVHGEFEGDVYFPDIIHGFEKTLNLYCPADENNRYSHTFSILKRGT